MGKSNLATGIPWNPNSAHPPDSCFLGAKRVFPSLPSQSAIPREKAVMNSQRLVPVTSLLALSKIRPSQPITSVTLPPAPSVG